MQNTQDRRRIMLVENDGGAIHAVQAAVEADNQFVFLGCVTATTQIPAFLDGQLPQQAPHVALADAGLVRSGGGPLTCQCAPDLEEGLAAIALIKQISPSTRVIGFSSSFIGNPQLAQQALRRGADALVANQDGPPDWNAWGEWLRYQIRSVIGGWFQPSPQVARLIEAATYSHRTPLPGDPLPLTPRQLEILHLLASEHTDAEIAAALHIVPGAVRGHISNIKERLHLRYRWQLIEEARRRGLGILTRSPGAAPGWEGTPPWLAPHHGPAPRAA